jgi:hypothetical protein
MRVIWILPLLGSLIAGLEFFDSLISATSAPQQVAGAAMAMCWAVLTVCVRASRRESVSGATQE